MINLKKIHGFLVAPVTSNQTLLPIDNLTRLYIQKTIPNNDFSYIMIEDKIGFEIVKITNVNGQLGATRGQLNTRKLSFYTGASIEAYYPTEDELNDKQIDTNNNI